MQQYQPHPGLSDYVTCFWFAAREFSAPFTTLTIMPDSYVELIFTNGCRFSLRESTRLHVLPSVYLVGLLNKPINLHAEGQVLTIAARIYSWAALPILGLKQMRIPDSVQPLGAEWHKLSVAIAWHLKSGDVAAAIEELQLFLLQRAAQVRQTDAFWRAARLLFFERGQLKIGELATRSHLSARQLERGFAKTLGIAPKDLARRIRFEHARNQLYINPHRNVSALALDLGYADQAHFIRDFKHFSQRTPGRFATESLNLQSHLYAQLAELRETTMYD